MKNCVYIPSCPRDARRELRQVFNKPLSELPREAFVRAWCCVAYLFPGLHPDGFEEPDSGWSRALRRFAAEAWRRANAGELPDEELYPSDAQWCGIFDRMKIHFPDETQRRAELATAFGETGVSRP
jgi:hypothetical protein